MKKCNICGEAFDDLGEERDCCDSCNAALCALAERQMGIAGSLTSNQTDMLADLTDHCVHYYGVNGEKYAYKQWIMYVTGIRNGRIADETLVIASIHSC